MIDWQRVTAQMLHPMKVRIIEQIDGRVASPSDLARELGERPDKVAHHVRQLRDHGVVRLVHERRQRGGMEHFYELVTE